MYHSETPPHIKDYVLASLMQFDGEVRIVIATSALGMGVNIRDTERVIHYGIPCVIEKYVQDIGSSGRDGRRATTTFLPQL